MIKERECLNCGKIFTPKDRRGKFHNRSCAVQYNNKRRPPMSDQQKEKLSKALKKRHTEGIWSQKGSEAHSKAVGKTTKGKFKGNEITSIWDVSRRTTAKILKRLKIGCSICRWDVGPCDIHHIVSKANGGGDEHSNLTYICPNCHRAYHCGALKNDFQFITLDEYIGDRWKEYYYG